MEKSLIVSVIVVLLSAQLVSAELTETEMIEMATEIFQQEVPLEYRNEYVFSHIEATSPELEYSTTYSLWWGRMINGMAVKGDRFFVVIDANTTKVKKTEFAYSYPASEIDTSASITKSQIDWFANKYDKVEGESYLFIMDKEVCWYVETESGYMEFDADTGEHVGGSSRAGNYEFDAVDYYSDTYGVYLIGLVGISLAAYLKRDYLSKILKM